MAMLFYLFGALIVVLLTGSLVSLDWQRRHSATLARTPLVDREGPIDDGSVRIAARGMRFHARVRNWQAPGDAIVLLHGWPQSSATWEPLADAAAKSGFRVIALDQRGYSPEARPRGAAAYALDELIEDVLAVADTLGIERFHLVGHDWGAAVGWGIAMYRPQRLLSWSALSIAHSYAFGEAVRSDPEQRRKSAYFLLFRLPFVPELLLSFAGFAVMKRYVYGGIRREDMEVYLRLLREPGALTATLNWYRAVGRGGTSKRSGEIRTPHLFIWGNRDPAAGRRAVELQDRYILGPYRKIEINGNHWLMERHTAEVVAAVVDHAKRYRARRTGASSDG